MMQRDAGQFEVDEPAAPGFDRVVWMGLRVDVPADWAIVRHSTNAEKGRLVWMDRRKQRMQLSWLSCPSQPDMKQVLADYRNKDLAADGDARFEQVRGVIGWHSLRTRGKRCLTRATRYDAQARRWVEVVLDWPEKADERIEREICGSFEFAERDLPARHWCAFGVDMRVAEGWELLRVDAKPADVRWLFSQTRREMIVRKLGMLSTWFDGDLRGLIARPLEDQKVAFETVRVQGHEAVVGRSREKIARVKQWMGRQRVRRDWVWRCEREDALWQVTVMGADGESCELADVKVQCCGGGRRG